MRDAICQECGSPLSVEVIEDEETGNNVISLFCEGPGDDEYHVEVDTHMWNDEFKYWDGVGSTQEITMKLVERKPDPYYKLDYEIMELVERN